jgi:DNA-binding MarR family transcriptional regulator
VYLAVGPLYRLALKAVEDAGPSYGVNAGVRMVLDLLRRNGPMTVPQMAAEQSLSRQFVQRMVNTAAADQLVRRMDNPAHRRSVLVALTDAGRRVIAAIVASEHQRLAGTGGDLTAADVDACLRVLTSMLTALEDVDLDQ